MGRGNDVIEWLNSNQDVTAKYAGKYVAVHPEKGIVAHGDDILALHNDPSVKSMSKEDRDRIVVDFIPEAGHIYWGTSGVVVGQACPQCKVERDCRLANEAELIRADKLIGELRAEVKRLGEALLVAEVQQFWPKVQKSIKASIETNAKEMLDKKRGKRK